MTPWERYFLVGRRAGCPQNQMQRFERADVILQQRQLVASAAARLCDATDGPTAIGYGGARGIYFQDRGSRGIVPAVDGAGFTAVQVASVASKGDQVNHGL